MSHKTIFFILATIFTTHAQAELPVFSIRGYGTLGIASSSEQQADFTGVFQPNGTGYTHKWDTGVDSRLGLQLNAELTENISSVLQVVSRHRYDNTYMPVIEWANVNYQVSPDFSVRLGRIAVASLMVSDYRRVGYANPWVRPPVEVYQQVPSFNNDGIDLSYSFNVGEIKTTLQAAYGQKYERGPSDSGHGTGQTLTATAEYGQLSARIGYSSGRYNITSPFVDSLFSGFRQLGTGLSAIPSLRPIGEQSLSIANKYEATNKSISLLDIGIIYDSKDWLIMTEYLRRRSESFYSDISAGYVTVGYRIKNLTPYLTVSRVKTNSNISDPGLPISSLPGDLSQTAAALNTGLNTLLNYSSAAQNSVSVGLRWDLMKNTALKLQYDRMRFGSGTWALTNFQPGFTPGTFHVISAALDFVF
jgi:hypothetical protein